jgi:hypothetical protein
MVTSGRQRAATRCDLGDNPQTPTIPATAALPTVTHAKEAKNRPIHDSADYTDRVCLSAQRDVLRAGVGSAVTPVHREYSAIA